MGEEWQKDEPNPVLNFVSLPLLPRLDLSLLSGKP